MYSFKAVKLSYAYSDSNLPEFKLVTLTWGSFVEMEFPITIFWEILLIVTLAVYVGIVTVLTVLGSAVLAGYVSLVKGSKSKDDERE